MIFTIIMTTNGSAWSTMHACSHWRGEAQRAHTAGRRQVTISWGTIAYRTPRQATNSRTYEPHPSIPAPRGDTPRHRHHTSMHCTDTQIEQWQLAAVEQVIIFINLYYTDNCSLLGNDHVIVSPSDLPVADRVKHGQCTACACGSAPINPGPRSPGPRPPTTETWDPTRGTRALAPKTNHSSTADFWATTYELGRRKSRKMAIWRT